MVTLAARLSNTGSYFVTGRFDETTLTQPSAINSKLYSTGDHYVSGRFDEVILSAPGTISLNTGNTVAASFNLLITTDPLTGYNTSASLWTWETWMYYDGTSPTTFNYLINALNGVTQGYEIQLRPSTSLFQFVYATGTADTIIVNPAGITGLVTGWNHFMVQKNATTIAFAINGNYSSTSTSISWTTYTTSPAAIIQPIRGFQSYLGPTRIVGGVNIYPTSNFTPTFSQTAQTSTTGVTTFLFSPLVSNIPNNIITNKGTIGTLSTTSQYALSNFTNVQGSLGSPFAQAKMYSNGVFAIAGIFDEVNHPV